MSVALALVLAAGSLSPGPDALESVTVGGRPRMYHVHAPAGSKGKKLLPAVINLHGLGSNALEQMSLSKMSGVADREGFLVLYPEGTGVAQSWNGGMCCGDAVGRATDDVAFIRAMLDQATPKYGIDPKRVYATGMSNGGFLSHRLACELADRIAAVAPVAGVLGLTACNPARPVSVLQFHGTADTLVQYGGGGFVTFPSVDEVMTGWARRDGCQTTREVVLSRGDVTCERFRGCPAGVEVELCRVEGGGHTWPGGPEVPRLGKTTSDVSATELMWTFFRAHSR